jgi:hypothetical protein
VTARGGAAPAPRRPCACGGGGRGRGPACRRVVYLELILPVVGVRLHGFVSSRAEATKSGQQGRVRDQRKVVARLLFPASFRCFPAHKPRSVRAPPTLSDQPTNYLSHGLRYQTYIVLSGHLHTGCGGVREAFTLCFSDHKRLASRVDGYTPAFISAARADTPPTPCRVVELFLSLIIT